MYLSEHHIFTQTLKKPHRSIVKRLYILNEITCLRQHSCRSLQQASSSAVGLWTGPAAASPYVTLCTESLRVTGDKPRFGPP